MAGKDTRHGYGDGRAPGGRRTARVLGWASLGLGVVQLAAPGAVRRLCGVDDSATSGTVVGAAGVRELVHAAGLLGRDRPAGWLWTRVAGDALDLTALGRAAAHRSGERRRRVLAVSAAVAGITALDLVAAVVASRAQRRTGGNGLHLHAAITVDRSADELYRYWHEFENLPTFMYHLESVTRTGPRRSHWVAKAPVKKTVQWDAEVIEDRADELIAWRSTEGSDIRNSGSVRFDPAPDNRGTEVRVEIDYEMPGGRLGTKLAKVFGEEPEQQVRDDLRRFKQVMETGEVVRSEGTPEGTNARRHLHPLAAQPLAGASAR